jgi:hypothetical protein
MKRIVLGLVLLCLTNLALAVTKTFVNRTQYETVYGNPDHKGLFFCKTRKTPGEIKIYGLSSSDMEVDSKATNEYMLSANSINCSHGIGTPLATLGVGESATLTADAFCIYSSEWEATELEATSDFQADTHNPVYIVVNSGHLDESTWPSNTDPITVNNVEPCE